MIPKCPVGYSGCLESWFETFAGVEVASGYAYADYNYTSSGAVTSIGADATASAGGRFLSDLYPYGFGAGLSGAVYSSSKDHVAEYGYPVTGKVTAQLIRVRKQP